MRAEHALPTFQTVYILPAIDVSERLFALRRERSSEKRSELTNVRKRQRVRLLRVQTKNFNDASRHERDVLYGFRVDKLGVRRKRAVHTLGDALKGGRRKHDCHLTQEQNSLDANGRLPATETKQSGARDALSQTFKRRHERSRSLQTLKN